MKYYIPVVLLATVRVVLYVITPALSSNFTYELSLWAWGEGMTKEKMEQVIWVDPVAFAEVEFLEWTATDRLRHTAFVAMRYEDASRVVRET